MWRTKSSYTSEGWHRSIAGTLLLLLASASPPLRSASVSRVLAFASRRFPFPRGRAFLSSWAGQRSAGGDFGSGWGLGPRSGSAGAVGFRFGLCWLLVAADSACLCARAGVWGWLAGVVWVSARLKWGTSSRPGDFTRSLPRIVAWFRPGPGLRSQKAVAGDDRANGTVCAWTTGVGPNGSGCNSFLLF